MIEHIYDQSEWLGKIKINELSNQALLIASKLSRDIRKRSGSIIKLQNPALPMLLAENVVAIDDDELNKLYRSFLEEAMRVNDYDFPSAGAR